MKSIKKFKNKYEALGFVEALIAIMVVGISSIVLMEIAVNTMQNTIQNEVIDTMTQYAVEGAEIAQQIADRDKASDSSTYFPSSVDWGSCFRFVNESGVYSFYKDTENLFVKYEENTDRDIYKNEAVIEEDGDLFRIVCLEPSSGTPSFVIGSVIVGQNISDGSITKGAFVKDYSYLTVIKL
jgi:hypothetical protein